MSFSPALALPLYFRLARSTPRWPLAPALISWLLLFGYQLAFALSYHGHQATVFAYSSGLLGDGLFLPALNVAGFSLLRSLSPFIPWRRLPLYVCLGLATAFAVLLLQAHFDLVNWSMPTPFHWSPLGQFHFLVLTSELTFLYLVLATAINHFSFLRRDLDAWRAFCFSWFFLALFALTFAHDYLR
jgi:hypothetical protein